LSASSVTSACSVASPRPAATSRAPTSFQLPGERLDIRPANLEQVELLVVAPDDELAEIKLVGVSGQPAVAGQEPTQRETFRISEHGIEGNDRR
jgi:hypothetical protein